MSLEGPVPASPDPHQSPQNPPEPAPEPWPETPPAEQAALPPAAAPKPDGAILSLTGPHRSVWVAPSAIRPLPGFGDWLPPMLEEIAAIDALVVVFEKVPSLPKTGIIHLEVPGNPPAYIPYTVEKRSGDSAPAARSKDEFFCLLLRQSSSTIHPVFVKSSEVPAEERMSGKIS